MATDMGVKEQVDRLWVLWGEPESRRRHVVGELWREPARGYAFAYLPEAQLASAKVAGFPLFAEFPEERGASAPYRSPYLFATFAQRVPSPKRPDFKAMLEAWGIPGEDDPMVILARSGGVLLTDRIEVAEYRDADDDLTRPLEFRLSGESRFDVAKTLRGGEPVMFLHEATNAFDPDATLVLVQGKQRIGYVPRQYSGLVSRQLASGTPLEGQVVRRLVLPPERDRWIIRVRAGQIHPARRISL